jgi:phenylpropionate dioxygenase-like ring-hydroxylating dioxygenase large terminal subunit
VLWVFPDASAEGWAASTAMDPPYAPEVDDKTYTDRGSTFARSLNYGYDTLLENILVRACVRVTVPR